MGPPGNEAVPRVLVLGGTGFIGRHVVAALRERGCRVAIGTRHPARHRGERQQLLGLGQLGHGNPEGDPPNGIVDEVERRRHRDRVGEQARSQRRDGRGGPSGESFDGQRC